MDIAEIRRIVSRLQSHLFKNANSFSVGMLKSHFRGAGLQFKEHQVYNVGDDVRFIDWKLSAKTTSTFVKTFEEERNVEITCVVDVSESLLLGFGRTTKLTAILEVIALLNLLAEKSKDLVKVVFFVDKIIQMPSSSGEKGIGSFIRTCEKLDLVDSQGRANLKYTLENPLSPDKKRAFIKGLLARRKEVVLLSDFSTLGETDSIQTLLAQQSLHGFQVVSPVDIGAATPISFLAKVGRESKLVRSKTNKAIELSGRHRRLDVSTRYLEDFVREML